MLHGLQIFIEIEKKKGEQESRDHGWRKNGRKEDCTALHVLTSGFISLCTKFINILGEKLHYEITRGDITIVQY